MNDTETRTTTGKVLFAFAMSLDGFVAGPHQDMDWMTGFTVQPGLIDEIDIHVDRSCSGKGFGCTATPARHRSASIGSTATIPRLPPASGTDPS
jgi:hypothetical protein